MPVVLPDTNTGLVNVIVTPGTAPPCESVARTRIDPVCTCAEAGKDTAAIARIANHTRTLMSVFLRFSVRA